MNPNDPEEEVELSIEQMYAQFESEAQESRIEKPYRLSYKRYFCACYSVVTSNDVHAFEDATVARSTEHVFYDSLRQVRTYERANSVKVKYLLRPEIFDCEYINTVKGPVVKNKRVNTGYTRDFVDFLRSKGYTIVKPS